MQEPLYKTIFNDMLAQIKNNKYAIGDKLPTEADLCEQYKVSRITAKKAMDMLSEKGFVKRRQGIGTIVIETNPAMPKTKEAKKKITIGLIQHDVSATFGLEFLQTIELLTQQNDIMLLTGFSNHSIKSEEKLLEKFRSYGVEGIIISPVHNQSFNNAFIQLIVDKFPLVLFDRYLKDITCPNVVSMNYEGAQEVINHLASLGHTNIAFLSRDISSATTLQERKNGILDAMAQKGLVSNPEWWITDLEEGISCQADQQKNNKSKVKALLAENPEITAVVCLKSFPVPLVFGAAAELEKRIPEDLSLIGFDSLGFLCNNIIKLTHIKQNEKMLAQKAFMMLLNLINGKDTPLREKVPVHLNAGSTTSQALV